MGGKKSGGLFESWLLKFATTVFSQSFHAIFLVFIMNMISEIQKSVSGVANDGDLIVAVVTFGGILALTRLEKLVKDMLGLQDGMEGGLGGNFHAAMHGLRAGTDLAKRTAEPFKKYSQNKAQIARIDKKMDRIKAGGLDGGNGDTVQRDSGILTGDASERAFVDGRENGRIVLPGGQSASGTPVSASLDPAQVTGLINSINNLSNSMNSANKVSQAQLSERKQDKLEDLEEEKAKLQREMSNAKYQRYTRLATTGAALGMAAGGSNGGINETLQMANAIDTVMDAATDKMVASINAAPGRKETKEEIKRLQNSNSEADRARAQELKIQLDQNTLKGQIKSFYSEMPVIEQVSNYKKNKRKTTHPNTNDIGNI